MKNKTCPVCSAKLRRVWGESRNLDFKCGTTIWTDLGKTDVRCTEGEKSYSKIRIRWVNEYGVEFIHTVFDCSLTYARTVAKETRNGNLEGTVVEPILG